MNKPHKSLLDVLLAAGALPIEEDSATGVQKWAILPMGETNMPIMILEFSLLDKGVVVKRDLKREIERYRIICGESIPKVSKEHMNALYCVIMHNYQKKTQVERRGYVILDDLDPLWLKISLAWTCIDWYIDARAADSAA